MGRIGSTCLNSSMPKYRGTACVSCTPICVRTSCKPSPRTTTPFLSTSLMEDSVLTSTTTPPAQAGLSKTHCRRLESKYCFMNSCPNSSEAEFPSSPMLCNFGESPYLQASIGHPRIKGQHRREINKKVRTMRFWVCPLRVRPRTLKFGNQIMPDSKTKVCTTCGKPVGDNETELVSNPWSLLFPCRKVPRCRRCLNHRRIFIADIVA